jgi:hypothetical protein
MLAVAAADFLSVLRLEFRVVVAVLVVAVKVAALAAIRVQDLMAPVAVVEVADILVDVAQGIKADQADLV